MIKKYLLYIPFYIIDPYNHKAIAAISQVNINISKVPQPVLFIIRIGDKWCVQLPAFPTTEFALFIYKRYNNVLFSFHCSLCTFTLK